MRLYTQIKNDPKSIHYCRDIVAGIIVALVSIPISMGYSQIAGLPVIYGLYGSLLPILVFGLFTTSPQFVVGVDAMPAAMVGSMLATLSITGETEQAKQVVPVITLLVGLWFILFYFLKAGRIVKYISKPVMGGFISGVGVSIILMQVPKLFGGATGTGELFDLLLHVKNEICLFNPISFALGIGTIIILLLSKKFIPKVPMTVIMLVVGGCLQAIFHFDHFGVKLLPQVAVSLPKFSLPHISQFLISPQTFLLQSFSIAAVIMAQTLLASGNYAMKYGDHLENDKELIAYSGMNLISAFTGCCPINGSVSRSGIADSFGCRSQIMSISASITMLLVILFGTPLFQYLPVPILTGIVMTALIGILEISLFRRLWKTSKREWIIFLLSFFGVLLFGTVNGVIIGCILSFADVALQATTPPTSFLGRIPGQGNFYALDRNRNARAIKHAVIYRFSGNLFFANIDKFQKDIENAIRPDTKCIVVDARGISTVDITAVDRLVMLSQNLEKRGIHFYLTEHSGHLNDLIRDLGGSYLVETGLVRRTITLALRDVGIEKPYDLEETGDISVQVQEEPDEMLAEFEWAFGSEAQKRMEQLAEAKANELANAIHNRDKSPALLEEYRVQTSWGTLGRFDENAFWDYLELRLEILKQSGQITAEELASLERRIEERRIQGEHRLLDINPHAIALLKAHREQLRHRWEEARPEEYAHIKDLQKQVYEHLKKHNPQLAEILKELHETKNKEE